MTQTTEQQLAAAQSDLQAAQAKLQALRAELNAPREHTVDTWAERLEIVGDAGALAFAADHRPSTSTPTRRYIEPLIRDADGGISAANYLGTDRCGTGHLIWDIQETPRNDKGHLPLPWHWRTGPDDVPAPDDPVVVLFRNGRRRASLATHFSWAIRAHHGDIVAYFVP